MDSEKRENVKDRDATQTWGFHSASALLPHSTVLHQQDLISSISISRKPAGLKGQPSSAGGKDGRGCSPGQQDWAATALVPDRLAPWTAGNVRTA